MNKLNFWWLNQYIIIKPLYLWDDVAKASIDSHRDNIKKISEKPSFRDMMNDDKDRATQTTNRIDKTLRWLQWIQNMPDSWKRFKTQRRAQIDAIGRNTIDSRVNTRNSRVKGNTWINIGGNTW